MSRQIHHINSEKAMVEWGQSLVPQLTRPLIIYLQGQLGMGKTTWVRGLLWGLGYQGTVKSPTFTLVESYYFESGPVFHFDLYRVGDPEELECIGLRDFLTENSVCVFEWPEKAKGLLPSPDWRLHLTQTNHGRQVEFCLS
jgi:tRNA threonylcarbamoyladenosine biosynthesis protein TsaE